LWNDFTSEEKNSKPKSSLGAKKAWAIDPTEDEWRSNWEFWVNGVIIWKNVGGTGSLEISLLSSGKEGRIA